MWRNEVISQLPDMFQARLVPLNKVWPEIPTREQFRPIVVLSPLFKWIESRFIEKLRTYMVENMDRN